MPLLNQMKTADLLRRILRGDFTRLTPYPFTARKPEPAPCRDAGLPRSTPEREGVPGGYLASFFREADPGLFPAALHSAAVLRHGKLIACVSRAPYSAALPHAVYSFSKSVVALAVGMAVDEGLLSPEDKAVSFFPEKQPLFRSPRMAAVTIRHLLTMTSGANFNEAGGETERDWVRAFFAADCAGTPGEQFRYNSMNSYLLAAILCRVTGQSLVDYLTPRLFEPLGVPPVYWETCPMGIEKGGWGLYLRVVDMAKLGQLFLQGGVWQGRRLIPEEWMRETLRLETETGRPGMERYGFQVWSFPAQDSFQLNGMFGQYAVVLPEHDMVVAATGGDPALFSNRVLEATDRFFGTGASACYARWQARNPQPGARRLFEDTFPENPEALRELRDPWAPREPVRAFPARLLRRFFSAPEQQPALPAGAARFCTVPAERPGAPEPAQGGWFVLEKSEGTVLPLVMAALLNNFAATAAAVRFRLEGTRFTLELLLRDGKVFSLPVGLNGAAERCTLFVNGEPYAAAVRGDFRLDEEGRDVLLADLYFLEMPSVRRLKIIRTGPSSVYVRFLEFPSVTDAVQMLLGLVGGEGGEGPEPFFADPLRQRLSGRFKALALPCASGRYRPPAAVEPTPQAEPPVEQAEPAQQTEREPEEAAPQADA